MKKKVIFHRYVSLPEGKLTLPNNNEFTYRVSLGIHPLKHIDTSRFSAYVKKCQTYISGWWFGTMEF